jgi:hypothetical protein
MSIAADFHKTFQEFVTQLNASFEIVPSKQEADVLSAQINAQQRKLNEALHALPAYDISRYQEKLRDLTQTLAAKQADSKPKTKFSFKSARKEHLTSASVSATPVSVAKQASVEVPGMMTISEQSSKTIVLTAFSRLSEASFLVLTNVRDCLVDLARPEGPYKSVTLRDIHDTSLQNIHASTSIFIDSCSKLSLDGTAQQWRLHDCRDCNIRYTCQTGRPVIENCTNMGFLNKVQHETVVDDFSDLSGDRRNWHILSDD